MWISPGFCIFLLSFLISGVISEEPLLDREERGILNAIGNRSWSELKSSVRDSFDEIRQILGSYGNKVSVL